MIVRNLTSLSNREYLIRGIKIRIEYQRLGNVAQYLYWKEWVEAFKTWMRRQP